MLIPTSARFANEHLQEISTTIHALIQQSDYRVVDA